MKLSAQEDVEVPIHALFDAVSDFDAHTRAALRRGAQVQRLDSLSVMARGVIWRVGFAFRGKPRTLQIDVTDYRPAEHLACALAGNNLSGTITVDLIALSANRSRMVVGLDVRPTSFSGRLLIQSLRLTKDSLTTRFKARVTAFAQGVEDASRID